MAIERRKDNKGRVLKTGESQRKDLIYQYRYTDIKGKRKTVYSSDLQELREKEKKIQYDADAGIDYSGGCITVLQLVERYFALRQGVRYKTKTKYTFVFNILKKEAFSQQYIKDIKASDAQLWMIKLFNDGKRYCTLFTIKNVLRPAFQIAFNEDIIRKNPFDFKLSDIVENDSGHRKAITEEQKERFMAFIREDKIYKKYYDEFIVLLHTGMRVSEFCGLTKSDLDFENRRIKIDHQLLKKGDGTYYIEKPKTKCGIRFIPMTNEAYTSLKNILANRIKVKVEIMVDGYSKFILLSKKGHPKVAQHIESVMRRAVKRYNKIYPSKPLSGITPHVFRHTFCTDMHNEGLDVKSLQYFMGHSKADTTLNIYTHSNFDIAEEAFKNVLNLNTHEDTNEAQ